MRDLTQHELRRYNDDGWLVLPGFFEGTEYLNDTLAEIEMLGQLFDPDFTMLTAEHDIPALPAGNRGKLYDALRHLATLNQLASSRALQATSRAVGMRLPAVMRSYNIRMDMPSEDRHLFHWHQDIAYLLGSLNSVTYWIPFGPVDEKHGSVEVIDGSHERGLLPVRYTRGGMPPANKAMSPSDLVLVTEPKESGRIIEADRGDLIIFSQFLLHRSVPNRSEKVRWTAQVRHSDLGEREFIAAGYPWGDATNLFHHNYLTDALVK